MLVERNLVFIEDTENEIIVIDLTNGEQTTFSKKYYHVWWAVYMNKNYGSLPLYLNKTNEKVGEFLNVDGHNGNGRVAKNINEARKFPLKDKSNQFGI